MNYIIIVSICLGFLFSSFAHASIATVGDIKGVYGYPLVIRMDNEFIKTDFLLSFPSIVFNVDQSKEDDPIERFTALIQHKKLIDAVNAGDVASIAKLATDRNDELFQVYIKMHQGKFSQTRQVTGAIIGNRTIFFEKLRAKSKTRIRYFVYKLIDGEWKWEYEKNDPMINIVAQSLEHGDSVRIEIQNGIVNNINLPLITSKEGTIRWFADDSAAGESAKLLLAQAQVALEAQDYQTLNALYTNESARKVAVLVKSATESGQTYRITDILNFQQHLKAEYISIPPFILESVKTDKGRRVSRYYLKMQDGTLKFTNFSYFGIIDDFLLKYDYSSPESTLQNFFNEYML